MGSDFVSKPVSITPNSPSSSSSSQPDPTMFVRMLQKEVFSRLGGAAFGAQTTAVSDPNGRFATLDTGFQSSGRLCIGWIMDATVIANAYRVHLEKGTAPIVAVPVSTTSQGYIGATAITTYLPGTCVVVMTHDKLSQGFILGVVPDILRGGSAAIHPYISQVSRKRVDDCHKKHIKQPNAGGVSDWSAWRPYDGTQAGEWGAVTSTGMAVTLDDFLVQMAVNEFCGVFGFYHDQLLRVAGYNMQTWTAGHERDAFMDQAEYNDIQGYSPFPWEAMGALNPATDIVQPYSPSTYQNPTGKPYYASWENKYEYQQPYHRSQRFYGYLGQGGRSVLHAPPENVDIWTYTPGPKGEQGKIYGYDDADSQGTAKPALDPGVDKISTGMELKPCVGLHEDNVGLDGRRFIASAKGITLAKRILLPMATRTRRPEDPDGDDATTNYKPASYKGEGPDHNITGDLQTGTEQPHLQRASAILDLHGYLFNYAGVHPFHWHAKDFKIWEQSTLEYAEFNSHVPAYTSLQGSMYLEQPPSKQIKVDHRYGPQTFYESESFVSMLEDGSVVIGDGYGAEIKLAGGSITIAAPGDIWLKSGRHAQLWTGGDCIIRANDSVDISTTENSVRIKSEKHVMVMAGNEEAGTPGGILLESRSSGDNYKFDECGDKVEFSGVVLRAPNSNVVNVGQHIYLRTGGGGSSITPGNITIDAGRGEADIVTKSNNIYQYVGQGGAIQQFFRTSSDDSSKKANYFSRNYTLLCGPLGCDADIVASGSALFKGSVICSDGHIFTGGAAKGNYFVAPCKGDCKDKVEPALTTIREYVDTILPKAGDQFDKEYLQAIWYADNKAGNTTTLDNMQFSFRTDEQYFKKDGQPGDSDFKFMLFEDRWQQNARLYGDVPKTWTEKSVTSKICGKTWPFPGGKWLEDSEEGFATVDHTIVEKSGDGLRDKDRGEQGTLNDAYSQPKFADIQKKKLNGTYPIVGRA